MTEPGNNTTDAARRYDAVRETARRETFRLARAIGARITTRPVNSMPYALTTRDAEPLAGARAALDLELAARRIARDYVRQAREAGHGWDQIAQALGLSRSSEKLADLAFDYVVGHPDPEAPWEPRYFDWTCQSCDKHISYRGLIQGPADDEIGHADGCPLLAAAIAAWDAEMGGRATTTRPPASAPPGDAEHGPAPRVTWTVGTLRAAIAGIPDDTPLVINATEFDDPDVATEQVITGAGFGTVDWGDGYGPEQSKAFGLDCQIPDGPVELRPSRPARALTAREPLAGGNRSGHSRESPPQPDWQLEAEP